MNSIEIAKKLIEENDKDIETFGCAETRIRGRIEKYKSEIEMHEHHISNLRALIMLAEEDLQLKRDQKKEYIVDNLALKMFVANGGGLDMLD